MFVVDDDEAIRDLVRALVESVGLPMETHSTAQSFLDAYDPARSGCPSSVGGNCSEDSRREAARYP